MIEPAPEASAGFPVFIGLGSNLGCRSLALREALGHLSRLMRITRVSSIYRSLSLLHDGQQDYFNLVCSGVTLYQGDELMERCLRAERAMGRERLRHWGARIIDIDIIDFARQQFSTPCLTVPHPRLHERSFVLAPLAEIAPEWTHPALGKTATELFAGLQDDLDIEPVGRLSWV